MTAPTHLDSLGEEIVFIPRRDVAGDVQLETTVYRPISSPPWPLVVLNHGSNGKLKSHHWQPRFRPSDLARFFLARGYLVAAPMRQGFSESTGESRFNCDHAEYALRYAGDIQAAVEFFVQKGLVRAEQVVVVGQSNGGMVTLGYGAEHSEARGIVNISGGIDTDEKGCDWREKMLGAATILGRRTKIPALWLYAEDDAIFPPSVSRPFFESYRTAGARARLVVYPRGGHGFAVNSGNTSMWGPALNRFLFEIGMPTRVLRSP
jgi:dienelactone hydrolase